MRILALHWGWRALQSIVLLSPLLAGSAQASRIVSLNLCTDEMLVLLAPDSVAALSPLARDPALSVVAATAAAIPWVRPDAEAVISLHPDLVLAGNFGAQAVVAVLRSRGMRVVQVQEPADFAGVAAEVTQIAAILGVPAKGTAQVARMQTTLTAVPRRPAGSAILWEARGFSAGPGSFGDAVLRSAGFINAGTGGQIGIEALVARPPATLITATTPSYPSMATSMLGHPALAGIRRLTVDPALLTCPGPWSADAVAALAK